jgi:hypothetical protein
MSGIIVMGVLVVVGIIAFVIFKVRWSRQAAREWAAREAARQNTPKP